MIRTATQLKAKSQKFVGRRHPEGTDAYPELYYGTFSGEGCTFSV